MKIDRIKVKLTGKAHLWAWIDFIEAVSGRLVDYETNGNVIKSITLSLFTLPDDELLKEYGFKCEVIS